MEWLGHFFAGDASAAIWAVTISILAFVGGEIARRVLASRTLSFLAWSAAAIALVGAVALAISADLSDGLAGLSGRWQHMTNTASGDPVVVGIYPNDAFGPLHRDGLHAGLAVNANDVRVVDLEASYAAMKANDAPELLARLRETLTHNNVIAVVGPPVTEFTKAVVREVERSGEPVPVFVTSATSRGAAGWSDATVPLFRINSGVDERADEFVDLARRAVARGIPLVFLVETSVNSEKLTYGQVLFDEIVRKIPQWEQWVKSGLITRKPYTPGKVVDEVAGLDPDQFLDKPQLIMLLGIGSDYRSLAEHYFRQSDMPRKSVLGGWMNAYSVEAAYKAGAFQWSKMFELTDIATEGAKESAAGKRFNQEFGSVTPARRDQAFSFDAATMISDTLELLRKESGSKQILADGDFLAKFAIALARISTQGVTGPIHFDALGQNIGAKVKTGHLLSYVRYEGSETGWRDLGGPDAVLESLVGAGVAPPS